MERLQAEKKVLFSLPEATELIGILKEVMPGALILHFLGLDTEVSCDPDLQERAKKLIGQKVGILRLNGRFYIRSIGENISVNETPNVDDKYPKKMEHFRLWKCCNLWRCFTGMHGVSSCGYNEGVF